MIAVELLESVRGALDRYVELFVDCIKSRPTRENFGIYVAGQLSGLERKSVEPIAMQAGVAPRTLQDFLAINRWNEDAVRDRLQRLVALHHADPHAIAVVDETADPKQGKKTPGVQRQYCGQLGKLENCIVTVNLGFASKRFHTLLDSELFLPESWSNDRARCRAAGIPDEVVHRPKWQIALELLDRAIANGVRFRYLVADEAYGAVPAFREAVAARGLVWIVEVPRSLKIWTSEPPTSVPASPATGRPRTKPVLDASAPPAIEIHELATPQPDERQADAATWTPWNVKDTQRGPQVWDVRAQRVWPARGGMPLAPCWLIVAINVRNEARKYFLSDAPADADLGELLEVAFGRWHIERCFRDAKQHIGLGQYEGRKWQGLKRHLILSLVSLLFLAWQTQRLRGENRLRMVEPGAGQTRDGSAA